MSVIGEQIKKYRSQKGYTQEMLGKEVGVTTQAVSKWERGSTPDAEVLPLIADVLSIDINTLYGREEQDLKLVMTKKLSKMSGEEAFRYTFDFCWAIIVGLTGDEGFTEDFVDTFVSHSGVKRDRCPDYFARLVRDEGMALARLSNDFSHFFLMTEPHDESVLTRFESMESIRKIFALLADQNILKAICYLYSMSNIPITLPLICKNTGLDMREAERCMQSICDHQLAIHMKIATVDGEIDSYTIRREACVIPLLCFADEIAKGSPFPIFNAFEREKPLL